MKPKAGFLSLAEELKSYILSFLPWQDIFHCASVSYTFLIGDGLAPDVLLD
jgi:hypothetical protein